jgi:hypothetical protein
MLIFNSISTWLGRGFALGLTLAIGACALFPSQKALRKCRFEVLSYTLLGVHKNGALAEVKLKALNPGNSDAKVYRLHLNLIHGRDTLAQVVNDSVARVLAHDSLVLPMQVTMPFTALASLAWPLAMGEKIKCLLQGDAYVDTPLGTYTIRNALHQDMVIDLGQLRNQLKTLPLR